MPDSALLVSLGRTRRGFLCDLSEGGIALDGFLPQNPGEILPLAFRLPDGGEVVEAIAQVVWTCDSRHRTGVRFVELADRTREQIKQWLSGHVFMLEAEPSEDAEKTMEDRRDRRSSSVLAAAGGHEPLRVAMTTAEAQAIPSVPGETDYPLSGPKKMGDHYQTTYPFGPVLSALALCAVFVGLGYYLPNMVIGPKTRAAQQIAEFSKLHPVPSVSAVSDGLKTDQGNRPEQSTLGAPVKATVAASTESTARARNEESAKGSGFVLQLAAMTHKENADALVETLRKKNFPAFVRGRTGDRFYRVDVGPYPDVAYTRGVEDELKGSGFGTALERSLVAGSPDSSR